jgi:protein-S-isoprenylcysteine O-methyltransferase Ste14
MLDILVFAASVAFPASEIALALLRRADSLSAQRADRGSLRILWLAIALGIGAAIACSSIRAFRLPYPAGLVRWTAAGLLAAGLALRWASILTLGRLFTVDVAIQRGHTVVERGLYGVIRHPSYAGLLLAFLGVSLLYVNWMSIVVLMVPVTLGVLNRIAKEERALLDALGPAYADYCARTKRLIPGVF